MKIEISNGKLFSSKKDHSKQWESVEKIQISNGIISDINPVNSTFKADITIDAKDCYIIPGLIDLNASLREPGYTSKGSIESETRAAAAGGVTTLCCTPDTKPINDSKAVTKLIEELSSNSQHCKVLPLGALTKGLLGEQLSEYAALKDARCVGLSNAYNPIKNLAITKRCFEYAKTHELSVFINPIEPSLHEGVIHENYISTTIGLQGIPSLAETIAVSQLIQLAQATGVHLHLSQLSAADSVKQLAAAKREGILVTADTAIQNLLYTDEQVEDFNSVFHCMPPLRSQIDRLALIEGINSGVIDAISSGHRPHEAAAKQMPFAETEPGISSIEFLLPMAMQLQNQIESNRCLDFSKFVEAMTKGPAKVLKLKDPIIEKGSQANICVFDPSMDYKVDKSTIISTGKNTPLINQSLAGRVIATIFEGQMSYQLQK